MIIVGYQGIGKSTLAKGNREAYLDLESSCTWVNGKRSDDWYEVYCNFAENLSEQGYNVFVSSHEVVRNRLKKSTEDVVCVVPAPTEEMKKVWIKKLQKRYDDSQLEKDYKALMNAKDRYIENINKIIESGFPCIVIDKEEYDLHSLIFCSIAFDKYKFNNHKKEGE